MTKTKISFADFAKTAPPPDPAGLLPLPGASRKPASDTTQPKKAAEDAKKPATAASKQGSAPVPSIKSSKDAKHDKLSMSLDALAKLVGVHFRLASPRMVALLSWQVPFIRLKAPYNLNMVPFTLSAGDAAQACRPEATSVSSAKAVCHA
eukprot:364915-Chlamydomonas_euryale.AAC.37